MRFVELCRKFEKKPDQEEESVPVPELSFENIEKHGMELFADEEILTFVRRKFRKTDMKRRRLFWKYVLSSSREAISTGRH